MTGGTYVVGDIHGCYNEWITLKDRIEAEDEDAKFILVGDIIDRGPGTIEMIDWAMGNITNDGKYQMVKGNHEFEKTQLWSKYYEPLRRYSKKDKIDSSKCVMDRYDFAKTLEERGKTWKYMEKFLNFCRRLPFFKDITIDGNRFVIVHANIPYSLIDDETYELIEPVSLKDKDFITFDRDCGDFDKIPDTTMVHGHNASVFEDSFHFSLDITEDDFGKIIYMKNRINVDCGCTYRQYDMPGNLAAIRLNDLKEYYLF